jgi:hypothetical protein
MEGCIGCGIRSGGGASVKLFCISHTISTRFFIISVHSCCAHNVADGGRLHISKELSIFFNLYTHIEDLIAENNLLGTYFNMSPVHE